MPSIEELKTLVKEFKSQGVSDEEIKKALLEMNVENSVIEELLTGEGTVEEENVEPPSPEEVPEPSLPSEPPETPEVTALPEIQRQVEVEQLHKKVEKIEQHTEKIGRVEELLDKIALLQEDMVEVKAQLRAIQKLLKEILNTERNILLDLYEKAKKR